MLEEIEQLIEDMKDFLTSDLLDPEVNEYDRGVINITEHWIEELEELFDMYNEVQE